MQSFRAICAKNNQKVELIVQYNSLDEARQALHKQGYSIVEIKEVNETENRGKVFYFDIIVDGNKKS
jgi:type II secretory pathway component PulF